MSETRLSSADMWELPMAVRWAVKAALASAVRRGSGGRGSDCDGEGGAVVVLDMVLDMVLDIVATDTAEHVVKGKGDPSNSTYLRVVPSRSATL